NRSKLVAHPPPPRVHLRRHSWRSGQGNPGDSCCPRVASTGRGCAPLRPAVVRGSARTRSWGYLFQLREVERLLRRALGSHLRVPFVRFDADSTVPLGPRRDERTTGPRERVQDDRTGAAYDAQQSPKQKVGLLGRVLAVSYRCEPEN